jgi:Stress responsive A/B Barrel Domain
MITHMVLLKVRRDVPQTEIDGIFADLAALRKSIAGITSFAGGPYSSPEGMQRGFTHGFCMTFASAAARDAYLPHPAHELVKARVLKALEGGVAGALAFDFES